LLNLITLSRILRNSSKESVSLKKVFTAKSGLNCQKECTNNFLKTFPNWGGRPLSVSHGFGKKNMRKVELKEWEVDLITGLVLPQLHKPGRTHSA